MCLNMWVKAGWSAPLKADLRSCGGRVKLSRKLLADADLGFSLYRTSFYTVTAELSGPRKNEELQS